MTCEGFKRSATDATNSSSSGQTIDAGMRQDMQQGIGLYRTFNRFGPSSIVIILNS
jgi:hypothetical protein